MENEGEKWAVNQVSLKNHCRVDNDCAGSQPPERDISRISEIRDTDANQRFQRKIIANIHNTFSPSSDFRVRVTDKVSIQGLVIQIALRLLIRIFFHSKMSC